MRATLWTDWTDPTEAALRAGGRRHYNAHRKMLATVRRLALLAYLRETGMIPWGQGGAAWTAVRSQQVHDLPRPCTHLVPGRASRRGPRCRLRHCRRFQPVALDTLRSRAGPCGPAGDWGPKCARCLWSWGSRLVRHRQ